MVFGPWQTVWKRHRRFSSDGTWDKIHLRLVAEASTAGRAGLADRGRLHRQPCPSARHQHVPRRAASRVPHRGLSRITRIWPVRPEPLDHALGRSRGGLSTKIHRLVDGCGRPLVIGLTAGQAGDSSMLRHLLAAFGGATARAWAGPHGDQKRYWATRRTPLAANRALLRSKNVKTVISEPDDQAGHRRRRGRIGGRPPAFDTELYKNRNVIERSFNDYKQWRGLATRYDKLATRLPRRHRAPRHPDMATPIRRHALVQSEAVFPLVAGTGFEPVTSGL